MALADAIYPTPQEVLDQILADIRFSFEQDGITVNLLPGSDHYKRSETVANRAAIAIYNNKISTAGLSPRTATGDDLINWCDVFGVAIRPAVAATGYLKCYGVPATAVSIPGEFQATVPSGVKLQVVDTTLLTLVGMVDVDGQDTPLVQVTASTAGTAGNIDAGTVVQWDSAAIGALRATAVVDTGGIVDGAEADDEETLRARLLRKLRSPGVGGNWSQVAEWAEEASSAVEAAYVYPAVRGPGSYDVVITKAGGDRTLSAATCTTVSTYVAAQMPGQSDINVTSVLEQQLDVVIDLTLPLPRAAGGAGGGWKDTAPWPSTADSAIPRVSAVSSTTITVTSTSADIPVAGKRFAVWNPSTQTMSELTIASVSGSTGAYVITPVEPIPNWVAAWTRISAAASNLSTYADNFAAAVEAFGPGEKTDVVAILPRGSRKPTPDTQAPAALTTLQLNAVANASTEILNIEFGARFETATTTTRSEPSVAAAPASAPRILTLQHLAFRRKV